MNWHPRYTFEQALTETVEWYRAWFETHAGKAVRA
jgi:nucleoside-diphosphate-sugar epimerase